MRLNRLVFCGLFSMFATVAFAGGQEPRFLGPPTKLVAMPDYSKWDKTTDHLVSYSSNGKDIEVRDEHYVHVNTERTEMSRVIVFYNPSTGKAWFAVYSHENDNPQKPSGSYLFNYDENGSWIFVDDLPDTETLISLMKSRYDLAESRK